MSVRPPRTARTTATLASCAALCAALCAGLFATTPSAGAAPPIGRAPALATATATATPPIRHVFVINIENKGFDRTWGAGSAAPYLSQTLRAQGKLLTQYFATAHNSQPNYVAQISGQGPNLQMQLDCQVYSSFLKLATLPPGQAVGSGCVFPASVPSLPTQLQAAGLSWKGYMDGMGTPCRHPAINSVDDTQQAEVGDQYAVRHNPFMYFAAITGAPDCGQHVVDLSALSTDLAQADTTPNLSYITPDLCNDGHDAPCVDGRPGGLTTADQFLQALVPQILASPAFQADGLLVITADESDSPESDASACCGEGPGPNALLPGILGLGGGRIGALLVSPFIAPGTTSDVPYNHYSLLGSIEDIFGLSHLGYANCSGLSRFGADVYGG